MSLGPVSAKRTPPPVADPARGAAGEASDEPRVVPSRHYGRWLVAAILLWLNVQLAIAVVGNPNIDFGVVERYLFDSQVMAGLRHTLLLTVVAMSIAMVLGTTLAAMRVSSNPMARAVAWAYVWIFRSVPVLLQLLLWFNLALLFPEIKVGIPGTGITLHTFGTNEVVTVFTASVLGLALAEAAYYSEIVRGGLLGVDRGQTEAAEALGMTKLQTFRVVVLPQAIRIIIPPTGNELIAMLKYSSLASVISYTDLAGTAAQIYSENLKTIELLLVISVWYIVCTTLLSIGQYFVERRYGRGSGREESRPLLAVLRTGWRPWRRGLPA